ncbi:uncharacterized protein LOC122289236 [Carya illinoinensis]|uniref:uncharacterized protein LOC122289236 n=1 Tax=Carya illinoinensis TaxID=32201 RepID=UPI001C722E38|nr:uncharacterized protein LOC122289236 [Carya illinoinensis]
MAEENSPNSSASSRILNPSDDSSSPYYLHPSDNPGSLLVSEIFAGDNYIAWSHSITIALTVKNKCLNHTAWLRANNLVLSWLMNSISKDIRNSLLYVASAVDLWNELKTRYLRSDGPRVFHLEKSLSCINQGSSSITEYFSAFKTLWDEYVNYRPFPTSTCGKMASCTYDLFNFLLLRQQSYYVLKFLVGLNDSYASVGSQLLLAVLLPSMAKVFSLLLQEESQRQLTNFTSNDTHALLAKHYTQSNQNTQSKFIKDKLKKSSLHCTHCGYNGHTIDKCFQLHGYPPGWTGPKGKRNLPSAHAAISTEKVYIKNNNENQRFSLTAEEFNKLIALANSSSTTQNIDKSTTAVNLATTQFSGNLFSQCNYVSTKLNSKFSWILDTGATDHMICSPLLYSSTPKPVTNSINLPNGQTVPALYIGTDQSMKKMIGIAYEKQGLYHLPQASSKANSYQQNQFNSTPISAATITQNQPNLWHYRLGHVSNSKIPFLR